MENMVCTYCLTTIRVSVFPLRFTGMHLICGCVDMEKRRAILIQFVKRIDRAM